MKGKATKDRQSQETKNSKLSAYFNVSRHNKVEWICHVMPSKMVVGFVDRLNTKREVVKTIKWERPMAAWDVEVS